MRVIFHRLEKQLWTAIEDDDCQMVEHLLPSFSADEEADISFHVYNREGTTYLMHAIEKGNADIINLLIDALPPTILVYPDASGLNRGTTPLEAAERYGLTLIADKLRNIATPQLLFIPEMSEEELCFAADPATMKINNNSLTNIIAEFEEKEKVVLNRLRFKEAIRNATLASLMILLMAGSSSTLLPQHLMMLIPVLAIAGIAIAYKTMLVLVNRASQLNELDLNALTEKMQELRKQLHLQHDAVLLCQVNAFLNKFATRRAYFEAKPRVTNEILQDALCDVKQLLMASQARLASMHSANISALHHLSHLPVIELANEAGIDLEAQVSLAPSFSDKLQHIPLLLARVVERIKSSVDMSRSPTPIRFVADSNLDMTFALPVDEVAASVPVARQPSLSRYGYFKPTMSRNTSLTFVAEAHPQEAQAEEVETQTATSRKSSLITA